MPEKKCYACGEVKGEERFPLRYGKRYKGKGVRKNQCRSCEGRYQRLWTNANPERRYWTRLKGNLRKRYGFSPSIADLKESLSGNACHICGLETVSGNREVDHVIPRCRGGLNVASNLAWTHRRCNRMKHDMPMDEFLNQIEAILRNHGRL